MMRMEGGGEHLALSSVTSSISLSKFSIEVSRVLLMDSSGLEFLLKLYTYTGFEDWDPSPKCRHLIKISRVDQYKETSSGSDCLSETTPSS